MIRFYNIDFYYPIFKICKFFYLLNFRDIKFYGRSRDCLIYIGKYIENVLKIIPMKFKKNANQMITISI